MLGSFDVVSLIPTAKPDEARAFRQDVPEWPLLSEAPFAGVFGVVERLQRLTPAPPLTPQPFSIIACSVPDIEAAAPQIIVRGVTCPQNDFLDQTPSGIWSVPSGGDHVAWFHDPGGNLLSVVGD